MKNTDSVRDEGNYRIYTNEAHRLPLEELMARDNKHVMIRFDPLRKRLKFSVMVGNHGRLDTDDPYKTLSELLKED